MGPCTIAFVYDWADVSTGSVSSDWCPTSHVIVRADVQTMEHMPVIVNEYPVQYCPGGGAELK